MITTKAPLPDWLGPDTPELRAKLQAAVTDREVWDAMERRILFLEAAMKRAADIIDRNLHHQREKVADASAILKEALQQ
jgi:hypothetical protein